MLTLILESYPSLKSLIPRHVTTFDSTNAIRAFFIPQILSINTTTHNACMTGDLTTAEQLLTRDINVDANNHTSHANRSFVMARKHDWDHALHDAIKVR